MIETFIRRCTDIELLFCFYLQMNLLAYIAMSLQWPEGWSVYLEDLPLKERIAKTIFYIIYFSMLTFPIYMFLCLKDFFRIFFKELFKK